MTWRAAAMICLLGFSSPRPVLADAPCRELTVQADAAVLARWPAAPERIRAAFATRSDVDLCASVRLVAPLRREDAISVEVALTDGRGARRAVRGEDDVVPTLEALLLVPDAAVSTAPPPVASAAPPSDTATPQPSTPPNDAPATQPGKVVASPAPVLAPADHDVPAPATDARSPRRLGFEIGLTAGARVGDGQTGTTLGVLSFLDVHGWLVGLAGIAEHFSPIDGDPPTTVLDVAALAGRRFRLGAVSLDLVAGPGLALWGHDEDVSVPVQAGSGPMPPQPATNEGSPVRVLAGARLNFNARSTVRPFLGVDGELALSAPSVAMERQPAWSTGLCAGVAVGTL